MTVTVVPTGVPGHAVAPPRRRRQGRGKLRNVFASPTMTTNNVLRSRKNPEL